MHENFFSSVYKKPPDPSVWSLDLKRKDEKLTAMLKSAAPIEKQQEETIEQMKNNRAIAARKIESYAKVSIWLPEHSYMQILTSLHYSTLYFVSIPEKAICDS